MEKKRLSTFWDRSAERYARRPVPDEAVYQKKLQITRTYFRPDMEVLEFGCGTGSTALAHAPYVRRIVAIDYSANMIDIARAKAEAAGVDNVTFREASIEDLEGEETQWDAVLGLSILHLLDNPEEVMAKVWRMLKPGGAFVTSTACVGETMAWFKYIVPVGMFLGLMPFVKVMSVQQLRDALIQAGFEIDHEWRPGKDPTVFIVAKKPVG